jgi:predicted aspartyl protease
MRIEFPLLFKQTIFGLVSDPKVPVLVLTSNGPEERRFLIDTGADVSVAPRRLAEESGLVWSDLPVVDLVGVEQHGVRTKLGQLIVRLN